MNIIINTTLSFQTTARYSVTAITGNFKGSSNPSFTIGKAGATLFQGSAAPDNANGVAGDLYIQANGANSNLYQKQGTTWALINSSGGGTGNSVVIPNVTQTAHGFSVGSVIYFTGTQYALAKADSATTAEAVGIVSTVTDANTFSFTTSGLLSGLSGLTAGDIYFVSDVVAGLLTENSPTSSTSISKPMFVALTSTSGLVVNYRGIAIGSALGGSGANRSVNVVNTNTVAGSQANTNYIYLVSGTTTITLPTAVGNTNTYTIKNIGNAVVTINTTSSQTIDGSTTIPIAVKYTAIDLVSDNSNWNIV